jgi:ketosteroid isomerase-like protein
MALERKLGRGVASVNCDALTGCRSTPVLDYGSQALSAPPNRTAPLTAERDTARAMSRENVEVMRRAYAAFNRGDYDGMVADLALDFEYVTAGMLPDTEAVYRGPEGWKEFTRWLSDQFDDARVQPQEFLETDDEVLAPVRISGRGKQSGVEARWDVWHLWTLRNGKIVRGRAFTDRDEALEAAGLSE